MRINLSKVMNSAHLYALMIKKLETRMRVTVILKDDEADVFATYCERNGFKKSTLIKRLIREHIENSGYRHQKDMFAKNPGQRKN